MKFIVGKKIGMSQIFVDNQDGKKVVPVTVVETWPCVVAQIKTKEKDGYQAVQFGFGEKKQINKPLSGHLKNFGKLRYLREFRTENDAREYKLGDKIDISIFEAGDKIKVSSISKSKGFQGVVKRHGFKGGPTTHGQKHDTRMSGSIGCGFPEHVLKGKRMAGRMGGDAVTQTGLEIAGIDKDKNLLLVKGSVPGKIGALVKVISQ